jgi:hypothetical protein
MNVLEYSDAQTESRKGHTLDNTPWSYENYDVCPIENENGLRPVIFEPEIVCLPNNRVQCF